MIDKGSVSKHHFGFEFNIYLSPEVTVVLLFVLVLVPPTGGRGASSGNWGGRGRGTAGGRGGTFRRTF